MKTLILVTGEYGNANCARLPSRTKGVRLGPCWLSQVNQDADTCRALERFGLKSPTRHKLHRRPMLGSKH